MSPSAEDLPSGAGGIRTHGLELMRLARTAAPLPRNLAGWSRTSDLRLPKPAGWPSPPQPEVDLRTPGGTRESVGDRSFFLRRRRNETSAARPSAATFPG